jgi:hypothetical protein
MVVALISKQRRAHSFCTAHPPSSSSSFSWLLGLVLVIIGSLGDFAALGLAAQVSDTTRSDRCGCTCITIAAVIVTVPRPNLGFPSRRMHIAMS